MDPPAVIGDEARSDGLALGVEPRQARGHPLARSATNQAQTAPFIRRWYRPVALGLALLLMGLLLFELWVVVPRMRPESFGVDLHQYLGHADRWLAGGSLYLDRQLQGSYAIHAGDSLYPPIVLYLLLPFTLGLPQLLWWVVPLCAMSLVVAWHRPRPWSWVVMAAMLAAPRTWEVILYGNPVIWVTAAVAGGTILGWPAVGVLLKPSLFPLALIGVRRRSWWIALAGIAVVSFPFGLGPWAQWIGVIRDSGGSWTYSVPDLLLLLIPVVAWVGSSRRGSHDPDPLAGFETAAGRP